MPVQLNSNQYIPTQLSGIKDEMNRILDDFMIPLVNATIVAEIKALAAASNLPQGFIDGVSARRVTQNEFEVINTWGTPETPLAAFFNYGTVDHWIEPVNAKALSWTAKSGRNASAIYFQGNAKEGDRLFSKGHYVAGVPKTEVMERGFEIGMKLLSMEAGKIVSSELDG